MNPKGIRATLLAFPLLLISPWASGQVYRCEGESGITFSDMPCGADAEEVQLEGMEPDAGADVGNGAENAESPEVVMDGEEEDLNNLLNMLQSQREYQIGEIDRHLADLRAQTESAEFYSQDPESQQAIRNQIAALETNRTSILDQYESLIAEAQSRLE
jgi:hypothetical protein